jgi:hypothetical protein
MSSDWKDTNAIWQDANDQGEDENFDAAPPLQGQTSGYPEPDPLSADEGDGEEPPEFSLSGQEMVGGLLRQFSPVLAPLLFGGITFLFILPFVLSNRAYLSPNSSLSAQVFLLAIGLVLLAFAVGQGIMLYYAGANDVLWSLGMICGFSLFLLTGCFAIFGPTPTLILLAVLVVVGFLLIRLYIRPTPEGRVDIVEAFGKHSRTLLPGLNFIAPWEKVVYKLDTRETVWSCPTQRVPVSRSEEVQLAASISYQLMPEDAHLAAFQVNDWEKSLHELFVATTQAVVGELSPEDFMAWPQGLARQTAQIGANDGGNWERINNMLAQRMQDQVAHWGVQINWVRIRDVVIIPHIPTEVETDPVMSPQLVDVGAARSTPPAVARLYQTQVQPKKMQQPMAGKTQSTQGKQQAPEPAPVGPPPTETPTPAIAKGKLLTDAYEAVRSGRITDPITIRDIASRFQSIANNPEESQKVDFDAARAAWSLLERAKIFEQAAVDAGYRNDGPPDWSVRRPSDDNLTAGG